VKIIRITLKNAVPKSQNKEKLFWKGQSVNDVWGVTAAYPE
jgi:hypothetical protein